MSATVDPLAALVAYLQSDPGVSTASASRVFGGELPAAENTHMPRQCVVLRPSGGAQQLGGGYQQFSDHRVDVFAYAANPHDAYTLYTLSHLALKALKRTVQAQTLIHWCRPAGGPLSLRDTSTEWPYVLSSWQVLYSEIPIAA